MNESVKSLKKIVEDANKEGNWGNLIVKIEAVSDPTPKCVGLSPARGESRAD